MKKIIIVIATLFLINLAFAQELPILASFTDGTASTDTTERYIWVNTERLVSQSFTLENSGIVDKVMIYVGKNSQPSTIQISITPSQYGYVSGNSLTTGTATIQSGTVSADSDYWLEIDVSNVKLDSGIYAILIKSTGTDLSNYLLIPKVDEFAYPYSGGKCAWFNDGQWEDFNVNIHFKVLGTYENNPILLILVFAVVLAIIFMLYKYYLKTKRRRR